MCSHSAESDYSGVTRMSKLANMDENVANELMSVLDENGDGEVDFEEFCNGWDRIFIVGSPSIGDDDGASSVDDEEAAAAAPGVEAAKSAANGSPGAVAPALPTDEDEHSPAVSVRPRVRDVEVRRHGSAAVRARTRHGSVAAEACASEGSNPPSLTE